MPVLVLVIPFASPKYDRLCGRSLELQQLFCIFFLDAMVVRLFPTIPGAAQGHPRLI